MTRSNDMMMLLALNLAGTFVFGISGGLAGVRAKLDLFGVLVLSTVVGLAGGVLRDVLIGIPPQTFRDWRYLVAVGAAGLISFFGGVLLQRYQRAILLFDAIGLSLFCVTGASLALTFRLGPLQAILLGTLTAIGGGMLRDVLLPLVFIAGCVGTRFEWHGKTMTANRPEQRAPRLARMHPKLLWARLASRNPFA